MICVPLRDHDRTMKTVEMTQATAPLADYARAMEKEPVAITEHGRPIAALTPIENAQFNSGFTAALL